MYSQRCWEVALGCLLVHHLPAAILQSYNAKDGSSILHFQFPFITVIEQYILFATI